MSVFTNDVFKLQKTITSVFFHFIACFCQMLSLGHVWQVCPQSSVQTFFSSHKLRQDRSFSLPYLVSYLRMVSHVEFLRLVWRLVNTQYEENNSLCLERENRNFVLRRLFTQGRQDKHLEKHFKTGKKISVTELQNEYIGVCWNFWIWVESVLEAFVEAEF